jgi:hypothetical protein
MERKPRYYVLTPVYPPASVSGMLVNASVGICQLCGEIATGMGGSNMDICLKCGNLLKNGRLQGTVKHRKDNK